MAQIQPKFQFLFNKNLPSRDFSTMTLPLTGSMTFWLCATLKNKAKRIVMRCSKLELRRVLKTRHDVFWCIVAHQNCVEFKELGMMCFDAFYVTHQNVATIFLTLKHLYFKIGFEMLVYNYPSIAQLVERRTVKERMQISLGHWFKSGSREIFFPSYFLHSWYCNTKY